MSSLAARPLRNRSEFLVRLFGMLTVLSLSANTVPAGSPMTLKNLPLIFVDDNCVVDREGVVRRFHPGVSLPAPVVEPDREWEGNRVYIYGAVMFDSETNRYRMWYLGRPQPEGGPHSEGRVEGLRNSGFDLVLQATSIDGIHWEKPPANLYRYNGTSDNNIIYDLHSPTVIRDEFCPDENYRYKMLGALSNYPEKNDRNYFAAHSPDGIHWKAYPENPVLNFSDTITLAQNPDTGEFLAYHKRPATVRGYPRRIVWLSRSMDFRNWTEPEQVLIPDGFDDLWIRDGDDRTEIYNMSVFAHAGGFVGFPTMFRVMKQRERNEISPGQSPVDGPIDVELATSPDGINWSRSWPRKTMIPRGKPGTYNAGAILGVATAPVDTENKTRLYYTAITTGHGGPLPEKRITIGLAEWRLHGFASLDAGPDGGWLRTTTLQSAWPYLVINADAQLGELRVALLDAKGQPLEGYHFDECIPLRSDKVDWPVRWENETEIPTNQPIQMAIRMKNARLFSVASQQNQISSRPSR